MVFVVNELWKLEMIGTNPSQVHLNWQGPLTLMGTDVDSCFECSAVKSPGLYLWTFDFRGGYLIYGVGLTTRPLAQRLREHMRGFRTGQYTILKWRSAQNGIRDEAWHGMWKGYDSPERQAERLTRRDEIAASAEEMLSKMRVFLAPLPPDKRLLNRLEAAIMNILYAGSGPVLELPDKGVHLEPRKPHEPTVLVHSLAPHFLHGLPATFEA
jgi:hypothetical protein